ncbi:protein of unknown function [Mesotoga infera]|uniref:Uncharacterized protein n=1 Tax=Mesotoga infera TaxID=1236046 RepID=A0A7Z7LDI8_9BACT|nr:protein of unknown function [Mesotoga infera]
MRTWSGPGGSSHKRAISCAVGALSLSWMVGATRSALSKRDAWCFFFYEILSASARIKTNIDGIQEVEYVTQGRKSR